MPHQKLSGGRCSHRIYRLDCAAYDGLLQRAKDRCELCGRAKSETPLFVDHDRKLGDWAVRGLLCNDCNCRLPWADADRIASYLSAAWYRNLLAAAGLTERVPVEPDGEVQDFAGLRWVRSSETGRWERQNVHGRVLHAMTWSRLFYAHGPHLTAA